MLSAFRSFAKSPLGIGVLLLIVVAFVVTLYQGGQGLGGMATGIGDHVAVVGGKEIDEAEIARRAENQLDGARQQDPAIDMARFVREGGLDRTIDLTITGRALEVFAADQGMVASKKLVDGQIASIPAFFGPTGKFDKNTFEQVLSARKLNERLLRDDFGREALTRMLAVPIAGGARVPAGLVQPYASLLLEAREGQFGVLPSEAFAPATAPTDAEVASFYQRTIARYTLPEQRVVRYATFDRSKVAAAAQPTEAEIAAVYQAESARFAGQERRAFTQIIVPTETEALRLLAQVQRGAAMADAARSVRREALTVALTDRRAFEQLTGPQVAAAAFAAPRGGFAPVRRSGVGFHVVRVDRIETSGATPLSAARATIAAELTQQKEARALADLVAQIEDEGGKGATFDELVQRHGLTAQTTPLITKDAVAIGTPGFTPSPAVQAVLGGAFQAEPDDDAAVSALPGNAGYVLWDLDRVQPSAPRPLAEVRAQVIADVQRDKGSRAAKIAADRIVAAVNAGTPLAQALRGAGVPLDPARPLNARRVELARAENVPAPLATLFAIPQGRARAIAVPNAEGWVIVHNTRIISADARQAPGLIEATQAELSGAIGDEYVQQFAAAVRAKVGVRKNDTVIARVKRTLAGGR